MSGNGAGERFVDVAHEILQTVTGTTGKHVEQMARDMTSIERLEHSTTAQVTRSASRLEQLHADAKVAKSALDSCRTAVADCAAEADRAQQSIGAAAELASAALAAIDRLEKQQLEAHRQLVCEMEQRNRAFEQQLRQDHDEFARMHARRLAKALEGQF